MEKKSIVIPEYFAVEAAAQFREETYQLIDAGIKEFDIDFHRCTFVDSTGLGVLVGLYKRCNEKGCTLTLRHLHSDVRKVFEMTRLDKVFNIQ